MRVSATPPASDPSPRRRLRDAVRALDDQRRRTLASLLGLLVTLLVWSLAMGLHHRFGSSLSPRVMSLILASALVGAFPAGLVVRWLILG